MLVFTIVYWVGLVFEIVIRAPFQKNVKAAKADRRVSLTENILLGLITLTGIVFPLIYSITHWLGFANYDLPEWMGWCGVIMMAAGLAIFARAHHDLKANWSPSLEIYKEHTLVTNGIYRYIRHPMYASQWLMGLAQALLLQNWLAGALGLVLAVLFYFARVHAEEKMMLDTFGQQYHDYMNKVGGLVPKLRAPRA